MPLLVFFMCYLKTLILRDMYIIIGAFITFIIVFFFCLLFLLLKALLLPK